MAFAFAFSFFSIRLLLLCLETNYVKNLGIGDWGVLLGFSLLLPLHHQRRKISESGHWVFHFFVHRQSICLTLFFL
jgi:hypothetical protein